MKRYLGKNPMTVSEYIREPGDVELSVMITFCIVEYLQQSDIIKAISVDDKKELILGISEDVMDWLAGDWENNTEEKTIC